MEEHSGTGKEHFHTSHKRSNSVGEYLFLNTFPRIPQIDENKIKSKQEKMIAEINLDSSNPSGPKPKQKYRCHSSARISLQTVFSMESCVRFIRKRRHLLSSNVKILLEESIDLLKSYSDTTKHPYIHELILIILTFEATPVIKLKEHLCSAIFKKTISLERMVDMDPSFLDASPTRLGQYSPIGSSPNMSPSPENFKELEPKAKKFLKTFKTILGKFRYLLAYLGFYLQCYQATESVTHAKLDYYIHKTFDSRGMRIETGRSYGNQINLFSKELISEDLNILMERIMNMEENEQPGIIEKKDAALNKYFRTKMEKWAQSKMENLRVTCRICSKQISAQKFDRHADLCNQKLQTESKIDQISEKLSELANSISKYQRMVNVELLIEKSALAKKKVQADSAIANLAKLQQMRQNIQQTADAKRNTLNIIPQNIEEAPDFEESTPMVRNGNIINFNDPFNMNPSFDHQLKIKNIKTDPSTTKTVHYLGEFAEVSERDESTPDNNSMQNGGKTSFSRSTADILDALDEEIRLRPQSNSISKPANKFTDFPLESLTEKSMGSENSLNDETSSTHSKESPSVLLKFEKNKTNPVEPVKEPPAKKPNPKKFYRQTSWDPWNNSEATENAQEFKLGGDQQPPQPSTMLVIDSNPGSLMSIPEDMNTSGGGKKGFKIDEGSKKLDEYLSTRRNKRGGSQVHGEKRKQAIENKQKLHKIKKLSALMKGYLTLTNNLNMIQQADHHSKEMTILIDEAKKTIKHNYTQIKDEKFRSISWGLLENMNKKQDYLRQIHQYQKELDTLDNLFVRFHESVRKKSRVHELSMPSIADSPDTPDSIGPVKKVKRVRAKSVQKGDESIRMEIFSRNIKKLSNILRKQNPQTIDEKRNTLLQNPNLQKMLGYDTKKYKPMDAKSRYSQQVPSLSPDKANALRRIRTTTIDLTPHRNPPKLSRYANKQVATRDDEYSYPKKLDDPKEDMKKSCTILPAESSSTDSNCSSDEEENKRDDDNESFEDFFDDHALGDDLHKDHDTNDTAYFSDDASTIKVFREKPSELANLIGINDFEFVRYISKGAYGKVWLVKRKATGDLFAMKLIPFSDRMNRNSIDSLKNEKKVFEVLKGDWVVKAPFTFVHENYLCIVMELILGGDFAHIMQEYTYMDENSARFYIAEVILALDSLHELKIIHRDLKPDNLLLGNNGHLKLTDFGLSEVGAKQKSKQKPATNLNPDSGKNQFQGRRDFRRGSTLLLSSDTQNKLAKLLKSESNENIDGENNNGEDKKEGGNKESRKAVLSQTATRIVGTPDYIAPEVLNGENYDDPCIDWWSVGVLLFEFLTGIPPFNADTVDEIFDNIKNLRIPWHEITIGYEEANVSPEAKDLIDKLLTLDRKKRLGARGVHEIQSHVFFKGFDWKNIAKLTPPLIPDNKISLEKTEFINPFDALGTATTKINTKELTFNRIDILHAENKKILEETRMKAKFEPTVQEGILQRRWSVYDEESSKKK